MAKRTLGIFALLSIVAILLTLYVLRATGVMSIAPAFISPADPFGTPDQAWASLTPAQRALQEAGTKQFSQRTRDRLARIIAVQGKFRGEARELMPFLADLESIDRSPASDSQGRQEDRDSRRTDISTIMRAWFAQGPYQDDSGIQFRIVKHAITMSNSAEYSEAVLGSTLVQVLADKWFAGAPLPDELSLQLKLIDESPILRWAVSGGMQALRTGEVEPASEEDLPKIREMIANFRPLGSTPIETNGRH